LDVPVVASPDASMGLAPGSESAASVQVIPDEVAAKKEELRQELAELENASQALPSSTTYDAMRADLALRIEAQKKAITKANPPDTQLEGCLRAIERAQKRKADAAIALAKASQDIENEDLNLLNLMASKLELEASIEQAKPKVPSTPLPSSLSPVKDVANSMLSLMAHIKGEQKLEAADLTALEGQLALLLKKDSSVSDVETAALGMRKRFRSKTPEGARSQDQEMTAVASSAPVPHSPLAPAAAT
jgi:hypothetical protein